MHDGSSAVISTAAYARIYEEQQPRLVAYARSLTRNTWVAEDLVAEAHFRVWRRIAEGHEIDNVSAYLTTTVRHLAYAAGGAVRETPRDPHDAEQTVAGRDGDDPADRVSSVDLLVRVLGQLPERWVKALWLAEAEGQPLAQIGPQLGTKDGATAVLLHRAREGMRQAFLRIQTGAPDDPACQVHWSRMPAYVRGAATDRQSDRLLGHVDGCEDCRARLAALMRANDRLPALVGPALLVFAVGGTAGRFLLTLTAAGASTGAHGGGSGLLHGIRQATGIGGTKTPVVVAAGAMAAGAAALVLILGPGQASPVPAQRTPVADAPAAQVPVTETPAAPASTPPPTTSTETATGGDDRTGTPANATARARTTVPPPPKPTGNDGTGGGEGTGAGNGNGAGEGTGAGNGAGDGTGGTTTTPTTPEPTPPAEPTDPTPPTTPPTTTDPTPPATTEPTPPAEPTDPTPPAEPTDPTPVDPPPGDDDCPPGQGDTGGGKKPGGKGRADGAGDVQQPPAQQQPHPPTS